MHFPIALRRVRIAAPQQRPPHKYRQIYCRSHHHIAQVQIAAKIPWRRTAVIAGLLSGDSDNSGKWPQRQIHAWYPFRNLTFGVQIDVLDLTNREFLREFAQKAGENNVSGVSSW